MARREVRTLKYTKLGLALSALACVSAVAAFAVIATEWRPDESIVDVGTITTPILMVGLLVCIGCGLPGFLLSLEGAAGLQGPWRKLGWVGFWVGATSTTCGLILGLVLYYFKY